MHVSLNKSSGQTSLGSEDLLSAWDGVGEWMAWAQGPGDSLDGCIVGLCGLLFLFLLGLHCCTGFSLVVASWGYSSFAGGELLIAVISPVVELRLQGIPAQ